MLFLFYLIFLIPPILLLIINPDRVFNYQAVIWNIIIKCFALF